MGTINFQNTGTVLHHSRK